MEVSARRKSINDMKLDLHPPKLVWNLLTLVA